MPRKKRATSTRRLFFPMLFNVLCVFVWASLLTFDIGDWPNPGCYPHNDPARNACGRGGALVAYQFLYWLGDGAYPLALFGTLAGGLWLIHGRIVGFAQRAFGLAILVACTAASVHLVSKGGPNSLSVGDGGVLGAGLGAILVRAFSRIGTGIVLLYSFVVGLVLTAEGWILRLPGAVRRLKEVSEATLARAREGVTAQMPVAAHTSGTIGEMAEPIGRSPEIDQSGLKINPGRAVKPSTRTDEGHETSHLDPEPADQGQRPLIEEPAEPAGQRPGDGASEPTAAPRADAGEPDLEESGPPPRPYPTPIESWSFPPLSALCDPETGFTAQQESIVRAKARLLEQTLEEFRLDARVVEIDTGPVITMFELQLGSGIKVSQVASLSNDIARALKAPAVRVVAPIPGKNTVGIEVPNLDKERVRLKELITLGSAKARKMALPLFLGKDASGAVLLADLAAMPHMLIAGTTGSGKSVCVNSIIASILMTKQPDEVKLILVDPKMVEMSQFKDVPHLMSPIITDMQRAEQILDWAVTKMDERYELLAEARVRNVATYNKLGEQEIYARFQPTNEQEKAQIPVRLPYIVVIIDELADLMMTAAKEVEHHLARLAQKSRAVGVHIVVSTQRPEAKVVTGLIKSNLPCRIAFRVASRMDSRIVLDQNGAEVLMGQGDMLFLPAGSHKLIRAQGTLLEDDELHRIITHLAEQASPEYHPQLMRIKSKRVGDSGQRDPLFDRAVGIVLETKRGSVSLLQRRLSVGYSRASRLIDEMAEAGVVGEFKGSQAREVMMTPEEWAALRDRVSRDVAEGNYAADAEDFGQGPSDDAEVQAESGHDDEYDNESDGEDGHDSDDEEYDEEDTV